MRAAKATAAERGESLKDLVNRAVARELGLPVIIHDREAHEDTMQIVSEEWSPDLGGVMHCFSGDVAMVKQCAEAGYVMSFAGNVTFANAQPLRDAAAASRSGCALAKVTLPANDIT